MNVTLSACSGNRDKVASRSHWMLGWTRVAQSGRLITQEEVKAMLEQEKLEEEEVNLSPVSTYCGQSPTWILQLFAFWFVSCLPLQRLGLCYICNDFELNQNFQFMDTRAGKSLALELEEQYLVKFRI